MSNQVSTLNGLYKERYADKVKDLVPDHVKLYNAIKFDNSKKVGGNFNEPVILSLESGFTYGGEAGNLFDLQDAKEFKMRNAKVTASELVLRSAISIAALTRSASGEQAIEKAMDLMVGNMLKSMYHRLEVQMFYGQSGIGSVASAALDSGNTVLTILDAEWAAGVWNGTVGASLNIVRDGAAILDSGEPKQYVIAAYSLSDKSVTITGDVTADISGTVHDLYFNTAVDASTNKNEFIGVHGISQEQTSLFGISNANEPLFQGSIQDVGAVGVGNGAPLSQTSIESGIAKMVEKGLMEEEVCVYVNPKQWNDLLSEQESKRVIDSSYSSNKQQNGTREIEFFGQNGTIKIKASTFVKEGYAYILAEKDLKRIGSEEVTFKRPDGEEYFKLLEGKNGVEMRCHTDQALFTSRPASICQLRYIESV